MKKLKVCVWSTGWIGSLAIATVNERSDLDLVGVWVHSPEKVGSDAGELAGVGPIGIRATDDVDALIALSPDCVIYAASGPEQDAAAVPDYVRLLRAGLNVVSVSTPALVYPPAYHPEWRAQMDEAARAGGSTFYSSGIEPGFAADALPLLLATQSRSIRSIRASEIFLYHEYPVAFTMRDVMGFGMPMDYEPLLGVPGVQTSVWGPSVRLVGAGLGADVTEIRERYDRRAIDRDIVTASGPIARGTCGAVRLETVGIIENEEAIVIEHVNRMVPDIAPDWPIATVDGTYRIRIEGDPDIACEMNVGDPESPTAGGMTATAMRVVNAIPYVVDAGPGLITSLDVPLTLPRKILGTPACSGD